MNKVYQKWGKPTQFLRRTLVMRQEGKCADCQINEWELLNIFQIHRMKSDGEYHPDNTVLLCINCHNERHKNET